MNQELSYLILAGYFESRPWRFQAAQDYVGRPLTEPWQVFATVHDDLDRFGEEQQATRFWCKLSVTHLECEFTSYSVAHFELESTLHQTDLFALEFNMKAWVLLLFTVICAYLTYRLFRWVASLENAPFRTIAHLWKGGLSHLTSAEQDKVMKLAPSVLGFGQLPWILLAITIGLAINTVRAFLE